MVLGHHYPHLLYSTSGRYRCQKCRKVFKRDLGSQILLPEILLSVMGLSVCPKCGSKDVKKYEEIKERSCLIDNVFRDKVKPVFGSVVCCDLSIGPLGPLFGAPLTLLDANVDHSGIYVGWGKIAHRDGNGYLKIVSTNEFISRHNGNNCAMSIYVSCKGTKPVGSKHAVNIARSAINDIEHEGYSLLWKNCHQFVQYCITGEIHDSISNCTFSSLQSVIEEKYGFDNWRVWELSYEKTRQI